MKKFGLFLASIILLMALSTTAYSAGQKVLIESFTGTWCGPCGSSGKPATEALLNTYPNDVFVCEMHSNDVFTFADGNTVIGTFNDGYIPRGAMNRNPINNGQAVVFVLSPTQWKDVVPQMLAATPVVEVKAFYSIAGSNLSVSVEATFLSDVTIPNGEMRFNVYINEDNLVAAQNGTSTPTAYNHKHVCRAMLGGPFGTTGTIPGSVTKGQTFTHTYNYTLNSAWKVNDLSFYAVVKEYGTNTQGQLTGDYCQILNACKATEGTPYSELTVSGTTASAKPAGTAYEKVFKLRNISGGQTTYLIELDKSSRTPSDWTAEVVLPSGIEKVVDVQAQSYEIKLNSDQQIDVTVKLTPNTVGAGDASFVIMNKFDKKGQTSRGSITVVSAEAQNVQVTDFGETADEAYSIKNLMTSAQLSNVVSITGTEFDAVGSMLPALQTLVWNTGEKGEISASDASDINSAINEGVHTFILGAYVHNIQTNAGSLMNYLGISYAGACRQGQATQGKINLIGYDNDNISNGFDQACQLINYLTPALKSTKQTTTPFLKHRLVDTVVAMKSIVNNTRVIFMGINPFIISNSTARNNLLTKCLDWIAGSGPSIECASVANFEETEVGSTTQQTITIENKGKSPLVVTEIEIDYDFQTNFKVVGATNFTVPVDGTHDLTFEFKPGYASNYDTWAKIKSNATNAPEKQISLKGKGIKAADGAVASLNKTSVDFPSTNVDETSEQRFDISNTGNQVLNVTNITVPGAYAGVFTVEPTSFSVAEGKKQEILVTFKPKETGDFNTNLTIVSNAKNSPVQLPITASAVVGVEDNKAKNELMTLSVGPNPFELNSKIEFVLNGSLSRNIEINLIDANGRTVNTISSSNFAPGVYGFDLNSNGLASGTYYLVAKTTDYTTQVPVVIVK